MPTCARDPGHHPHKKQRISLEMNSQLLDSGFLNNFKHTWKQNVPSLNKSLEVIVDPFKVCVIQNFLHNNDLVNDIRQEFYELDFNQRNMDLYEFFQSKDLKYLNSTYLRNFYEFLKNDVMNWVCVSMLIVNFIVFIYF